MPHGTTTSHVDEPNCVTENAGRTRARTVPGKRGNPLRQMLSLQPVRQHGEPQSATVERGGLPLRSPRRRLERLARIEIRRLRPHDRSRWPISAGTCAGIDPIPGSKSACYRACSAGVHSATENLVKFHTVLVLAMISTKGGIHITHHLPIAQLSNPSSYRVPVRTALPTWMSVTRGTRPSCSMCESWSPHSSGQSSVRTFTAHFVFFTASLVFAHFQPHFREFLSFSKKHKNTAGKRSHGQVAPELLEAVEPKRPPVRAAAS